MDRFVCQKIIARELNLSQSTVSLALRDRPGVNKKTATKVKAAAEKLGYVPDPMLTSLADYRNQKRPPVFRSVLPWLHADENLSAHREDLPWGQILAGARERASQLGYKLEPMQIGESGQSPEAFARMLHARGVAGVISGPSTMNTRWLREFTMAKLPIVCVGTYTFGDVQLVHVSADHYQNGRILAQDFEKRGFKKVLVLLRPHLEKVLMRQYASLFQRLAVETDRATQWLVHLHEEDDLPKVAQKILKEKPDAIILQGGDQYRQLSAKLNARTLQYFQKHPVGLLCHCHEVNHPSTLVGVDERLEEIGAASIDQLSASISSWKIDRAQVARRVLIEGTLCEVKTTEA